MKVIKNFSFDSERDADILAWLSRQGDRKESAAIREAIREKMGVSLDDVYRKLVDFEMDIYRELQALKRAGLAAADPNLEMVEQLPFQEPDEAAAALDKLLGG